MDSGIRRCGTIEWVGVGQEDGRRSCGWHGNRHVPAKIKIGRHKQVSHLKRRIAEELEGQWQTWQRPKTKEMSPERYVELKIECCRGGPLLTGVGTGAEAQEEDVKGMHSLSEVTYAVR